MHSEHIRSQYELSRLEALTKLNLLDTAPSEALDRITRLAARLFGLPYAAVSLTDSHQQWFKSRVGFERTHIPRSSTPCAFITGSLEVLVINDLLQHADFCDSLLSNEGVRFYAGAPLITREGYCLGAVCVLGTEPRTTTTDEIAMLGEIAAMVMTQIELQHSLGRLNSLSGLPNRTQFEEDFNDLCYYSKPNKNRICVILNLATPEQLDTAIRVLGVAYVDKILDEAKHWVRDYMELNSQIYHVGPTQFAWIASEGTEEASLADLLRQKLVSYSAADNGQFLTTATFGLASFCTKQSSCLDVLRWCHSAARDAIETTGRVNIFDRKKDEIYKRRYILLNEFSRALEFDDQLHLVFQPRVDMISGKCVGAEALLRWDHPTLGSVSPEEFIPVIEQTSIINSATFWVLNSALLCLASLQKKGVAIKISMNVSSSNLIESGFAQKLIDAVSSHGVAPSRLELEITESAVINNHRRATNALLKIAAHGIGLAIDDFGTGYSNLSYLQNLPVDVIKIDRSFIRTMLSDTRSEVLVATMIQMFHVLEYRVVAEGVETEKQFAHLRSLECDEAQGFLLSRPMPFENFLSWYENHCANFRS